jgi:hypothetical protein
VSPGYAQKDPDAALRRIADYQCRYLLTLQRGSQSARPGFLNATAPAILSRVASDPRFYELPSQSRFGLVLYAVEPINEHGAAAAQPPPVPASVRKADPVPGGKSALDSINGSVRAEDGSFTVPRTGVLSCDGWAFDDTTKSTPPEVWLELTNSETGNHHYWHAQRYSRPALAAAVKIPSVANAGFLCDSVGYRLAPGTYSARIFQVNGGFAKVSGLDTYSKPPRVAVR